MDWVPHLQQTYHVLLHVTFFASLPEIRSKSEMLEFRALFQVPCRTVIAWYKGRGKGGPSRALYHGERSYMYARWLKLSVELVLRMKATT